MNWLTRILRRCAGAVVALGVTASLLHSAQAQQPVKLTLWMTDSRSSYKAWLEKYIAEYRKTNPHVSVDVVQMAPSDAYVKWPAAVAAGNTPDITWMFFAFAAWLHELPGGGFVPMDDVTKALGENRFSEPTLTAWRYKNHQLCVPVSRQTYFLFYRKDLFREAGLSEPKTWADVIEAARALHQPQKGQFGIAIAGKGDWSLRQNFEVVLYSNGGDILDPQGSVVFDSPQAVRALEIYQELFKYTPPGSLQAGYVEINRMFGQGAPAMVISLPVVLTQFLQTNPDKTGQVGAVIPSDVGRDDTVQNYRGWCVFKRSRHADEAKKFVRFLYDTQAYADHLEAAMLSSLPVYNDPAAIEKFFGKDATSRAFPDATEVLLATDRGYYAGVNRFGPNPKAGVIGNEGVIERHLNRFLAEKGNPARTARAIQTDLIAVMKR